MSRFFTDKSLYSLLLANLLTIFFALHDGWGLATILAIYYLQSVTIGIFTYYRIKNMQNIDFTTIKINGKVPTSGKEVTDFLSVFFPLHYGGFHFVYFIFLLILLSADKNLDVLGIILTGGLFFINHFFSYRENIDKDKIKRQNIGKVFMEPYLRIIPMHITIILAFTIQGTIGLILFMALKTGADILGHILKHALGKPMPIELSNQ